MHFSKVCFAVSALLNKYKTKKAETDSETSNKCTEFCKYSTATVVSAYFRRLISSIEASFYYYLLTNGRQIMSIVRPTSSLLENHFYYSFLAGVCAAGGSVFSKLSGHTLGFENTVC